MFYFTFYPVVNLFNFEKTMSPCGPFVAVLGAFDHVAWSSSTDGVYLIDMDFPGLAMLAA